MSKGPRRYLLAACLLAASLALAALPSPRVDNSAPEWVDDHSESARAYAGFQRDFGSDEVFVVFLRGKDVTGLLDQITAFEQVLSEDPLIERVISLRSLYRQRWEVLSQMATRDPAGFARIVGGPLSRALGLLNPDDKTALLYGLSAISSTAKKASLQAKLDRAHLAAEAAGVEVRVAGNPLVNLELDRAGIRVEEQSLPVLVGVCIVLLLGLTRSLRTTLVALAPAGLVVKASEGALWLTGVTTNIVVNIAKPLLFVLLLAGTLHIIVGWQDAHRAGVGRVMAPWCAVARKGKAVALAFLTTAIGFGSLVLSDVPPIRHFGLLAAAGLLVGIFQVLLLLPAMLRFIPPPPDRGSRLGGAAWQLFRAGLRARFVGPVLGLAIVGLGLFLARGLESDPHAIHYFQPDHHLRRDHEALDNLGVGLATAEVIITGEENLLTPASLRRVGVLSEKLSGLPGVRSIIDPRLLLREAAFRARLDDDALDNEALLARLAEQAAGSLDDFVAEEGRKLRLSLLIGTLDARDLDGLRRDTAAAYRQAFQSSAVKTELSITGNYEILLSTQAGLLQTLKSSLLLTTGLMTLLFLAFLRSLRTALVALVPNLFPVCLNFLLMRLFRMPLDVGTSMTAAIALGIAVDDTLHISLAWNPDRPEQTARSTGRAVILSSVIIGAGFISLMASDFIPTRNFGLLSATAMGSALLADLLILPPLLAWAVKRKIEPAPSPSEVSCHGE
jgi:uncharacterized protein